MPIIVNHDGSFHAVTQAAIRQAFIAALEPLPNGLAGPEARFKVYREALARFSPASETRAKTIVNDDLVDLFPEYNFPESGNEPSMLQYFDGIGTMIYLIKNDLG